MRALRVTTKARPPLRAVNLPSDLRIRMTGHSGAVLAARADVAAGASSCATRCVAGRSQPLRSNSSSQNGSKRWRRGDGSLDARGRAERARASRHGHPLQRTTAEEASRCSPTAHEKTSASATKWSPTRRDEAHRRRHRGRDARRGHDSQDEPSVLFDRRAGVVQSRVAVPPSEQSRRCRPRWPRSGARLRTVWTRTRRRPPLGRAGSRRCSLRRPRAATSPAYAAPATSTSVSRPQTYAATAPACCRWPQEAPPPLGERTPTIPRFVVVVAVRRREPTDHLPRGRQADRDRRRHRARSRAGGLACCFSTDRRPSAANARAPRRR